MVAVEVEGAAGEVEAGEEAGAGGRGAAFEMQRFKILIY